MFLILQKIPTRGGTPPSLRSLIKVPLHFKENRKRHFTDERHSFTDRDTTNARTTEQQNTNRRTGAAQQQQIIRIVLYQVAKQRAVVFSSIVDYQQ